VDQLEGSELALAQAELLAMFGAQRSGMARRLSLNESGTHQLTDPNFKCNVLIDHKCDQFLRSLMLRVTAYLTTVGIDAHYWARELAVINSWATLTQRGESALVHDHGNTDISGVYYIQTTGDDGDIWFKTPNEIMSHSYLFQHIPNSQSVRPAVGQLILWPGYMWHGTHINQTDHERISVSFNIQARRWYQDRLFAQKPVDT
jgi:hypothetical protein